MFLKNTTLMKKVCVCLYSAGSCPPAQNCISSCQLADSLFDVWSGYGLCPKIFFTILFFDQFLLLQIYQREMQRLMEMGMGTGTVTLLIRVVKGVVMVGCLGSYLMELMLKWNFNFCF